MFVGSETTYEETNDEALAVEIVDERLSADFLMSFSIKVDQDGNIQKIDSLIDMPENLYDQAAKTVWKNKEKDGRIELNNKIWQYSIMPDTETGLITNNGKATIFSSQDGTNRISFLDITDSMDTLRNLAYTFTFVGLALLAVLFFISLVFAKHSIQPVLEAWEKQKQFVANASHELKTPISIINANYDVLMANQDKTIGSQLKWLQYMQIGTERMKTLINQLLTLAKLEDTNIELPKEEVNISNMIEENLVTLQAYIEEKELDCKTEIEPNVLINSHSESLQRIIMILLENAVQHVDHTGKIVVSLEQFKKHIKLSITNSGQGIPKSELPYVFERFYQVNPSRQHTNGNYGLGLSIAKLLLDKLNGKITVQSIMGQYTTFTIKLDY
ncbi:sensor histidine kinase [Oceanobacillus sp. FSL K6-0251]|uniref:sensor histidine kinase n=1 Tax=Oceanobacillus sp. FSL K6-0251 TaxID=2921602 RepID=UPI0030F866C5